MAQPRYAIDKTYYEDYILERNGTRSIESGIDNNIGVYFGNPLSGAAVMMAGFVLRNMDHPMTNVIGLRWYSEILKTGIMCQISLAFVYERYSRYIGIFDENWI
jgi:hypothetical protein